MKFIATTSDKISSIEKKANQLIFSRDDRIIYLDTSATDRTEYTSIIVLPDETFRTNITHPVTAFYFVEDSNILYRYNSQWQQLTTPPQESLIFLKRENFPTIGKEKTLYIDEENIYQWNKEKNDYVNMSGGNAELIWEDLI